MMHARKDNARGERRIQGEKGLCKGERMMQGRKEDARE